MAYSPSNKSDYSLRNGSGTMSLSGHSPLATKPPDDAVGDPRIPLINLSVLQNRMNSLQKFLSESLNSNTLLGQPQLDMVSSEIASAIHQTVLNGAALLSCSPSVRPLSTDEKKEKKDPGPPIEGTSGKAMIEMQLDDESDGYDIIELDAVELLAEHVHLCEICGKGFKRDANLRMHMRAHGNQFKTPEALAKPEKAGDPMGRRRTKFSCPYLGCNRNKQHKKFRPLKSAICVKNHFKRSHCPKMYSCNRCNKKSFSVVAALKSHMKHCGESKWRCACGTSFSRKDKLFGHMALFEGHVPAVMDEGEEEKGKALATAEMVVVDDDDEEEINARDLRCGLWTNNGFSEGLLDEGFNSIDDYCIPDVLSSPKFAHTFGLGVEGFLNF